MEKDPTFNQHRFSPEVTPGSYEFVGSAYETLRLQQHALMARFAVDQATLAAKPTNPEFAESGSVYGDRLGTANILGSVALGMNGMAIGTERSVQEFFGAKPAPNRASQFIGEYILAA